MPDIAATLPPQHQSLSKIITKPIFLPKMEAEILDLLVANITPNFLSQKEIRDKLLMVGSLPLGQLSLTPRSITSTLFISENLMAVIEENNHPFFLFLNHEGENFRLKLYNSECFKKKRHKHLKSAQFNPDTMNFRKYHQTTGAESYKFHQIQALTTFHLPVIDLSTLKILRRLVLSLNSPNLSPHFSGQESLKLIALFAHIKYILRDLKVKRVWKKTKKKWKKKKSKGKTGQKKTKGKKRGGK
jgi:hypothetical protein